MKEEVNKAANFVAGLFKNVPLIFNECFEKSLVDVLIKSYTGHWHAEVPDRGSAFRCVTIFQPEIDDRIAQAWKAACKLSAMNLNLRKMLTTVPKELSVWVDPFAVAYRIGDFGSIADLWPTPSSSHLQHRQSRRKPKYNSGSRLSDTASESDSDCSMSSSPNSRSPSSSPPPAAYFHPAHPPSMTMDPRFHQRQQCSMAAQSHHLYPLPPSQAVQV